MMRADATDQPSNGKQRRRRSLTSPAFVRHAQFVERCVEARISGMTVRAIAEREGSNPGAVHRALMESMQPAANQLSMDRRRIALEEHLARLELVMNKHHAGTVEGNEASTKLFLDAASRWAKALGVDSFNESLFAMAAVANAEASTQFAQILSRAMDRMQLPDDVRGELFRAVAEEVLVEQRALPPGS